MKAKRVLLVLIVCALAFLCFTATAYAKKTDVPFVATMSGFALVGPGEAFDPPLPPSPSPTGLWTVSYADGWIGSDPIQVFAHHPTPVGEAYGPGDMILTWGGDDLRIRYWGYMEMAVPGPAGTYTGPGSFMITGGTGRFADAYGGGTYSVTLEYPGGFPEAIEASWTWTGTVKYASGKQPVNWASLRTNTNNVLLPYGMHQGTSGKVQRFAEGTLTGQVLLKALRGLDEFGMRLHSLMRLDTFTCEDWGFDQADFYHGVGDYEGADIAEVVGYLPNPAYDPENPDMGPAMIPLKFLWVDFGEPGKADLMQWYVFTPPNEEIPFFHWEPQLIIEGVIPWGDPIPIPNGNIQVHVGY